MSVLSWGKPKLETALSTAGTPGAYTELPVPVEGSSKLTTSKGGKLEAKQEGGEIVDSKYKANTYVFEFELFAKKGSTKPIADTNGIIAGKYAIRLTPEDPTTEGWVMENCTVSIEDTWDAENGKKWKYTFEALNPASGSMLKEYTANTLEVSPTSLSFSAAEDATGKTITASSSGNITAASSDEDWATVIYSLKVATVKVSANANTDARTANVSITADGKTVIVVVTQAGA